MKSVLFVCLGNICRSPTAHGVFQAMVNEQGLDSQIFVDSAGTAAYHIGNAPDHRSTQVALSRGYDLADLRARQAVEDDFHRFDYIMAMDHSNLNNLKSLMPVNYTGHLNLFLDYTDMPESEVPDPYYGGDSGFEHVLDLVESASRGLLEQIKKEM
ncbi:MAG: low molecular weight protein-tyrosine-phosphatase [Neptuniibacter sp.]